LDENLTRFAKETLCIDDDEFLKIIQKGLKDKNSRKVLK